MRRKWAERLLAHLHTGEIAHLAPLWGDNEEQEFHDLLGDTRFRTLRQRCLVGEQMLKWDLPIPWKESNVTSSSSVGTHYVGSPRNLDFWLCRKNTAFFRRSRPWRQDSLLQWYSQPGKPKYHLKKSSGPWKKVLAGVPLLPGAHSPQEKGAYAPRQLDTFILGIVRYQVGCDSMIFSTRHHPL